MHWRLEAYKKLASLFSAGSVVYASVLKSTAVPFICKYTLVTSKRPKMSCLGVFLNFKPQGYIRQ